MIIVMIIAIFIITQLVTDAFLVGNKQIAHFSVHRNCWFCIKVQEVRNMFCGELNRQKRNQLIFPDLRVDQAVPDSKLHHFDRVIDADFSGNVRSVLVYRFRTDTENVGYPAA